MGLVARVGRRVSVASGPGGPESEWGEWPRWAESEWG